jgi:hypothetical protein
VVSPEDKDLASNDAVYVAKRAAAITNALTNDSIFLQADNSSFAAFLALENDIVSGTSRLDGRVFYARASGRVITSVSSTLILTMYFATAAKTAITYNGTGVTSLGATHTSGTFATASGNWFLEALFTWDVTSKILGGRFQGYSSATPSVTADTVLTNQTSVDLSVPGPGLVMGCHFGTTGAGNICTMTEFTLEVR